MEWLKLIKKIGQNFISYIAMNNELRQKVKKLLWKIFF